MQIGTGKAARQRDTVRARINDGVLFPTLSSLISDRFHAVLQQAETSLLAMINDVLKLIRRDVDSVLGSEDRRRSEAEAVADVRRQAQVRETLAKINDLRREAEQLAQSCPGNES